jgi:hypothetical protein
MEDDLALIKALEPHLSAEFLDLVGRKEAKKPLYWWWRAFHETPQSSIAMNGPV